jgi:CBS domain-containing protein
MKVQDLLATKGSRVLTIEPGRTVREAIDRLVEHRIGALLVVDGESIVGIITERDILQRVVAQRRDPAETLVQDAMTAEVICCQSRTTLDEARGVMKNRRVRHLPVVDEGRLLMGLISIGDLNAQLAHDQEVTIHVLEEYIHGRA